MGQVWTLNDWNNIIQQVNDLAQNPEQGCDPVSPLESVDPPHKWSKADIQQVQDKLREICDENQFGDIPDKWKQSIIDEINDAIARGWCKECCEEPCDDAGEEIEQSEVVDATGCYWDSPNCAQLPPDPWDNWPSIKQQALELGFQAASASFDFSDFYAYYCSADKECQALEDKIETQQQIVASACGGGGDPAACAAAQATLAQYQDMLQMYQEQRDSWQSQAEDARSQADALAQQQAALLEGFTTPDTRNMYHLVTGLNHPWSGIDCQKIHGDTGPARCMFRWSMSWLPEGSQNWGWAASGMFTPNGIPYATYVYYINAGIYIAACCGPNCMDPFPGNICAEAEHQHRATTWRVTAVIDPGGYGDCP